MLVAIAGNQNSGKTTLFNLLTGSNQHVGNFPGVTVESKTGTLRLDPSIQIADLPGIYSLSPYSGEETVARDFLIKARPDAIVNIVDATNIERNLYLTVQLLQLGIPVVIALNMIDEVRSNNWVIKTKNLEKHLGVRVMPISAAKNEGISELVFAIKDAKKNGPPPRIDFCSGAIHRTLHAVAHLIEDHAANIGVTPMFAATKIIEGDAPLLNALNLSANEKETITHLINEMTDETGLDQKASIADMRYNFIEGVVADSVIKGSANRHLEKSAKIDKLLTSKYLGIPIFLGIMLFIFYLTFGVIGSFLSDSLAIFIDLVSGAATRLLQANEVNPLVISLVTDGIFLGVGSVLSFVPTICVLFLFLSILEDSGYMARIAFIMDKPFRKIGLSGRSVVPLLMGLGCTVPAVMATRIEVSERDRKMTAMLTPFMSCSAKLPIYATLTAALFTRGGAFVMMGLYLFGILTAVLVAVISKQTKIAGSAAPFLLELPSYRMPDPKSVLILLWEKAKDFIYRVFTIVFLATVLIWFLQTFDVRLNPVADSSRSILAGIGRLVAPLFTPLGFNDWRPATALITGFIAKEAVISTLSVLVSNADLTKSLGEFFTQASALSFLVFTLLYSPCVAAVATVKKEFGGKSMVFAILFTTFIAYLMSFIVYNIARFIL